MLRVRCVAKEPYSPPFELVGLNFAPWFPAEEREVHDELGQRLLFDKHFEKVIAEEKAIPKERRREEPEMKRTR